MDTSGKKKVNDERTRLGLGRHIKKVGFQSTVKKSSQNYNNHNQLTQLKAANTKYKRTIASLKISTPEESPSNSDVDIYNAGDAFGGKAKKS